MNERREAPAGYQGESEVNEFDADAELRETKVGVPSQRIMRATASTLLNGVKQLIPDHVFLRLSHHRRIGRWPNLRRPRTFNEMILRRCLHPAEQWTELTDKLSVREYVRRKIGEAHLIPLLAVPDTFDREVFDALPEAFVMKATHGCGFVEVVNDKSKASYETLAELATTWLATDFYRASRERHYRRIEPRLFVEARLSDGSGRVPADIKLHIFKCGRTTPRVFTMVVSDRFGDVRCDVYDDEWNWLEMKVGDYRRSDVPRPAPPNWEEVVRIGRLLASDFDYVRVDLYSTEKEIYFGELTFTPGAGVLPFYPDRFDYEWGRLMRSSAKHFGRGQSN
jgi:hypothetical protein